MDTLLYTTPRGILAIITIYLFIRLTASSVAENITLQCSIFGWSMNNEFERIWKEKSAVITGSIRVLRGTEENHEKT